MPGVYEPRATPPALTLEDRTPALSDTSTSNGPLNVDAKPTTPLTRAAAIAKDVLFAVALVYGLMLVPGIVVGTIEAALWALKRAIGLS